MTEDDTVRSDATYPFRLGCTSYVLPDHILPNVEFMADKVDDIELVLFESEDYSNLPDPDIVSSLQHIGEKTDTTFSVHFPIDRKAGSANAGEREQFLATAVKIINLTSTLPVSGYLLHFEGLADFLPSEIERWKKAVHGFCTALLQKTPVDPSMICIENLGYPADFHNDIVKEFGFSHCIDLGHLWMNKQNWEDHVTHVLDMTRIIHLHGFDGKKDHQSLEKHYQHADLQCVKQLVQNYTGVITLEVFGKKDTFESLSFFEELWL